jgi:hypothetical protein
LELRTDLYRPLDHVDIFEDLEPQIAIEVWVVGKKLVDHVQRLLISLPAKKGTEPVVDEKDLSRAFERGKLGQCSFEIRLRKRCVTDRVERPDGGFDPTLADVLVVYKIVPEFGFILGCCKSGMCRVGVALGVVGGFCTFSGGCSCSQWHARSRSGFRP